MQSAKQYLFPVFTVGKDLTVMNSIKIIKNERGTSSIFIVIILLCLLTFGILSMMSSFADLKLARKAETWVNTYYQLDNQGNIFISEVDLCLQNARDDSQDFMQNSAISFEKQGEIGSLLSGLGPFASPDTIYMLFAWQALNSAGYQTIPSTPEQILSLPAQNLVVNKLFSAPSGNATQNLTVSIVMIPWSEQQIKRYQVLEWVQWQDQIHVPEDSMRLWQGD